MMRGFTLIELLVVIAIISILLGLTIPSFTGFSQATYLKQGCEQLLNDLRSAESRSQAALTVGSYSCWGVVTTNGSNSYTVNTYDCSNFTNTTVYATYTFPSAVTVSAGGGSVTFNQLTGTPTASAAITLSLNGVTRQVVVESGGNMYVQ